MKHDQSASEEQQLTVGWLSPPVALKRPGPIIFDSAQTVRDYDVVIWSPIGTQEEFRARTSAPDEIPVGDGSYVYLRDCIERRRADLSEVVRAGGTVVVLCAQCLMQTAEGDIVNLCEILPLEKIPTFVTSRGKKMKFCGDGRFSEFWDLVDDRLEYVAYMETAIGDVFLRTLGDGHPLGSWVRSEQGNVVFLPTGEPAHLANLVVYPDNPFERVIRTFVPKLRSADEPPPPWASDYVLPGEHAANERVKSTKCHIREGQRELDSAEAALRALCRRKLLLYGTGDPLQCEVIDILRALGIDAKEGPKARGDAYMTYQGKPGVAEVGGVEKSAPMKKVRQANDWVNDYLETNGEDPKGFVIVNTYRGLPPSERTSPDFESNVAAAGRKRRFCLLTTTQLLGIFLDTRTDPEKRDAIVGELFRTEGVYTKYRDIKKHLTTVEDSETADEGA